MCVSRSEAFFVFAGQNRAGVCAVSHVSCGGDLIERAVVSELQVREGIQSDIGVCTRRRGQRYIAAFGDTTVPFRLRNIIN